MRGFLKRFFPKGAQETPPPADTLICTLSPEERERVNDHSRLATDAITIAEMMKLGANAYWWQLRAKHKLPETFDYHPQTGEIHRKGVDGVG